MTRRKFIIDTDPGVDDAMSILMALAAHARGEIEILGFTLVAGNASMEHQLINLYRVLDCVNCGHFPVYIGAESALVAPTASHIGFMASDGFNCVKFDDTPDVSRAIKDEQAFQFIQRSSRKYPGEVSLVALGPLTNLALAFKTDSDLSTNLATIYLMGGNSDGEGNDSLGSEFNFMKDPESAYIVLEAVRGKQDKPGSKCPTYIAGWELCAYYSRIDVDFRVNVLGKIDSPEMKLLNRLEETWFDSYYMCDQLAMAVALEPDIIEVAHEYPATVELHGEHTRGQLLMDRREFLPRPKPAPNATVIKKINMDRLKEVLLKAFKK